MPEINGDDLIQSAIALRTARAIDEHLTNMSAIKRMQVENEIEEVLAFRDQYLSQQANKEVQESTLTKIIEALSRLIYLAEHPPKFAPPPTQITLEQQPVTVNIPKGTDTKPVVNFSPVVTIPESQVVIDRPEMPMRAVIKHSDGTRSEIEFKS